MIATYRLQLTPDFGFAEVEALIPYFQALGISHLYLSPITEARPGSDHGYDVIDHNTVRADFGGREGFERLRTAAHDAGHALILDFVPNHAGVGTYNAYWQDVLAYGPHAPHAHVFDIDWTPLKEALRGKVLLPFLGRPYGDVLDDGELRLVYEDGRFYAAYYDNAFAIAPPTYPDILDAILPEYERTEEYFDLKELRDAFAALVPEEVPKSEALHRRLHALSEKIDLDGPLEAFTDDRLHALLEKQYWRLAYWKTAGYEINYRRFFDINGLVGLCMEDDRVFWKAHTLLGELLAEEGIAGVRIDHIDGLFDPHGYLARLRDLGARHIWVEKILAHGETLPDAWPVEGTTGYEFMNDVMGVLLRQDDMPTLERVYRRFVPEARSYEYVVHRSKVLVMDTALSSELFRLAYGLNRLSEADYHTRDFTLEALREALAEIVAAFRRYRTYLPYGEDEARVVVREVVHRARQRTVAFEPSVYDFIAQVILGEVRDDLRPLQEAWTGRFQQYTAPVAAKGVEDTAFYRYVPLVALNEVGGEPEPPGQTLQAFHAHARFRAQRYPHTLVATATHDHKRGEDTRMRLIALAEEPDLWDTTLRALAEIGERNRGHHGPSRADEFLFYQILVALWEGSPTETLPDRLWTYMQKAARESKRRTSWINPDDAYENDLETFIRGVLADSHLADALDPLAHTLAVHGFANTLSQVVLKFTTPGVPDIYQGCELLDLSLVDPDNRRPVDYDHRHTLLGDMQSLLDQPDVDTLRHWINARDERAKFYLTAQLLRMRRAHPTLFSDGSYRPLEVKGPDADAWIAYARTHGEAVLLVVVPRFSASRPAPPEATLPLPDDWPASSLREVLTGHAIDPGDALNLADLPLPWAVFLGV